MFSGLSLHVDLMRNAYFGDDPKCRRHDVSEASQDNSPSHAKAHPVPLHP